MTCPGARTCVVVTIHERQSMHSDEVDAMAFADWERAEPGLSPRSIRT